METTKWCCVNYKVGDNGEPYFLQESLDYYRSRSIAKFIEGSGRPWWHWRDKIGWQCIKVKVTITILKKATE